ncbi:hypothetical protein Fot_57769 [Forsythia ovata]|uniref:Uncharacterized protein n=1 Tax=Forsythia ovata TaxID=205694 RepID=A0ABD1NU45_9LAMI
MSHKKMSIAQTMSNLAEQVQMLVQENRAMITLSSGRIVDDEKIGIETRAPAVSHSHPCSDPSDSRLYQPVDLLKERERRPARSASVFDRLGNEADFHQRNTPFHDSRRVESHPRDPIYEHDYSYNDEGDGLARLTTGLRNQNHKVDVNKVTPTRSKTTSEVSASHSRSKFYRIHRSDYHDTKECPKVRAMIDKMVENRYKPSGSQMGQPFQPRPVNYTYHRRRGRGTRGRGYRPALHVPHQTNQRRPNE